MNQLNIKFINGKDVDITNVIFDVTAPIEKCGELNEKGKLIVRDIVAYDDTVKSTCIGDDGVLHCIGDCIAFE